MHERVVYLDNNGSVSVLLPAYNLLRKVHKVTRRYLWGDTPGPISITIGVSTAPHDVPLIQLPGLLCVTNLLLNTTNVKKLTSLKLIVRTMR